MLVGSENTDSIKSRLRNNSGTPKKLRKDLTPSKSARHFKMIYESEGKRMEKFLNKPQSSSANNDSDDSAPENEVYINKPEISTQTNTGDDATEGVNATSKDPLATKMTAGGRTAKTSRSHSETHTTMMQKQEKELLEDIKKMENKLKVLHDGSMEKLFLELRLDIKKDNLLMMTKIVAAHDSTAKLEKTVTELKTEQKQFDTRLRYTQDCVDAGKMKTDQVFSDVNTMREQIRILQGVIQVQDQKHELVSIEKEAHRFRESRNNLLIAGLDEEGAGTGEEDTDDTSIAETETMTTTAEMVTDFFTQTMKIPNPIPILNATRIGKATPRTVLVKLKDYKDKGAIFKHVANLKEAKNSKDEHYFVNNQLSPQLQEQQRWYRQLMHFNANLAGVGKRTMSIKKGQLYVDGIAYTPPVRPAPPPHQ